MIMLENRRPWKIIKTHKIDAMASIKELTYLVSSLVIANESKVEK